MAMSGTYSPLSPRRFAYSYVIAARWMVGIPHSFIIRHGLIPVPPPAPSTVRRSIFAFDENFTARAKSTGRYAPVFRVTYLAPIFLTRSTSFMNDSSSTIPRRECLSNSAIPPSLCASFTNRFSGSGCTMYPLCLSCNALSIVGNFTSPPMHFAPCPHLSSMPSTPSFSTAYSATPSLVSSTFNWTSIVPYPSYQCLYVLTLLASSGELTILPFLISACGSIPQTFSPQTSMEPLMAAPIAVPSQFTLAISVEPRAPVKKGNLIGIFVPLPVTSVSTLTEGKVALSGSASQPIAPTHVP